MANWTNRVDIIPVRYNDTIHMCSIYSLSTGFLSYTEQDSGDFQQYNGSFPAYYITNCSDPVIRHLYETWQTQNFSHILWDFEDNQFRGGDAIVSLLFTISGTCCVCWMLSAFLMLSPSHKQKPILTQLSTVMYTILLTIILAKITRVARQSYYSDVMGVIKLHDVFLTDLTYRVINLLCEFLMLLAFLQVIFRISPKKWRRYLTTGSSIFVLGLVVTLSICEGLYRESTGSTIFDNPGDHETYFRWHQAKSAINLIYLAWIAILLAWYTLYVKNPRKYSYSLKLLPLACFIWLLFGLHFTVCVLIISVYSHEWKNRAWLTVLRDLLEIGVLSIVWEWLYNIKGLERRSELMGVLGRRISYDDITIFHTNEPSDKPRNRFDPITWIKSNLPWTGDMKVIEEDQGLKIASDSNEDTLASKGSTNSAENSRNDNDFNDNDGQAHYIIRAPSREDDDNNEEYENHNNITLSNDRENESDGSLQQFEDEVIEDYEFYHNDQRGESSNLPHTTDALPPPFEPHPNFSPQDYYPDTKH